MTNSGKKKLHWFPVYVTDFMSDPEVIVLSPEEIGAYFRLLLCQGRDGSIPGDAAKLSVLTGAHERWPEISDTVLQFFSEKKNGRLVNKKLDRVLREQQRKYKSYRDRGLRGMESRWASDSLANGKAIVRKSIFTSDSDSNEGLVKLGEVHNFAAQKRPPMSARELTLFYALEFELAYSTAYLPQLRDVNLFSALIAGGTTFATVATRVRAFFGKGTNGRTWWDNHQRSKDGSVRPNVQEFVWRFNDIGNPGVLTHYKQVE